MLKPYTTEKTLFNMVFVEPLQSPKKSPLSIHSIKCSQMHVTRGFSKVILLMLLELLGHTGALMKIMHRCSK